MIKIFLNWLKIIFTAAKRFYIENYTYQVSALTFTTLLAIVPLFSVISYFLLIFPIFTAILDATQSYVVSNFIPGSGYIIQHYMDNFVKNAQHLPFVGIVFLFITSGMLMVTIKHTINDIWKLPSKLSHDISALIINWLLLIVILIFIGASVLLSSYISSLLGYAGYIQKVSLIIAFVNIIPFFINFGLFTLFYILMPNCRIDWRDACAGGLIAALLFEIAKFTFTFYLQKFPTYALIYGIMATIPIFFMWLYICWFIILFGAFVTHERYLQRNLSHRKGLVK